jgi:hypothetical protein
MYDLTCSQRKKRRLVHPDHLRTESEEVETRLRERATSTAFAIVDAPRDLPQLSRHEREIERSLLHGKRVNPLDKWLVGGTRPTHGTLTA